MVQDWDQQYLDFSPLLPSPVFLAYASAQSPGQRLVEVLNPLIPCLSDPKTPWNLDLSTNQGIPCIPPNRQSFLIISTPCPVLGTIARVWAGVAPHWSVAPASVELPTCNARPVEKACSIRQQRGGSMKKCGLRFFGARRLAKKGENHKCWQTEKKASFKTKQNVHRELANCESFFSTLLPPQLTRNTFNPLAVSQPARLRNIQALVVSTLWCNG